MFTSSLWLFVTMGACVERRLLYQGHLRVYSGCRVQHDAYMHVYIFMLVQDVLICGKWLTIERHVYCCRVLSTMHIKASMECCLSEYV